MAETATSAGDPRSRAEDLLFGKGDTVTRRLFLAAIEDREERILRIRGLANLLENAPARVSPTELETWSAWFPAGDAFSDEDLGDWSTRLLSRYPRFPRLDERESASLGPDPIAILLARYGQLGPGATEVARRLLGRNRDREPLISSLERLRTVALRARARWFAGPERSSELDSLENTIDSFEASRTVQPEEPGTHNILGNAYFQAGDLEAAGRAYNRALGLASLHPDQAEDVAIYARNRRSLFRTLFSRAAYRECVELATTPKEWEGPGGPDLLFLMTYPRFFWPEWEGRDFRMLAIALAVCGRWDDAEYVVGQARTRIGSDDEPLFQWHLVMQCGSAGLHAAYEIWKDRLDDVDGKRIVLNGLYDIADRAEKAGMLYGALAHWTTYFLVRKREFGHGALWYFEDDVERFARFAALYRRLPIRPALPQAAVDAARRAEALAEAGDGGGAIDAYLEALDEAPWWPEGYYNLALLGGLHGWKPWGDPRERYLQLEPSGTYARPERWPT